MATFDADAIRSENQRMRDAMRAHARQSHPPYTLSDEPGPFWVGDGHFFDGESWLMAAAGPSRARDLQSRGQTVLCDFRFDGNLHTGAVGMVRLPWAAWVWIANATHCRFVANELTIPNMSPADAWFDSNTEQRPVTCTIHTTTVDDDVKVRLYLKYTDSQNIRYEAGSGPQSAIALMSALVDGHWADPAGTRNTASTPHTCATRTGYAGWIDPVNGSRNVNRQDRVGVPVFESLIPQSYSLGFVGNDLIWQRPGIDWAQTHAHLRIPFLLATCNHPQSQGHRSEWLELGMKYWAHQAATSLKDEYEAARLLLPNQSRPSSSARHRL